jgi:hypothetical protein
MREESADLAGLRPHGAEHFARDFHDHVAPEDQLVAYTRAPLLRFTRSTPGAATSEHNAPRLQ